MEAKLEPKSLLSMSVYVAEALDGLMRRGQSSEEVDGAFDLMRWRPALFQLVQQLREGAFDLAAFPALEDAKANNSCEELPEGSCKGVDWLQWLSRSARVVRGLDAGKRKPPCELNIIFVAGGLAVDELRAAYAASSEKADEAADRGGVSKPRAEGLEQLQQVHAK